MGLQLDPRTTSVRTKKLKLIDFPYPQTCRMTLGFDNHHPTILSKPQNHCFMQCLAGSLQPAKKRRHQSSLPPWWTWFWRWTAVEVAACQLDVKPLLTWLATHPASCKHVYDGVFTNFAMGNPGVKCSGLYPPIAICCGCCNKVALASSGRILTARDFHPRISTSKRCLDWAIQFPWKISTIRWNRTAFHRWCLVTSLQQISRSSSVEDIGSHLQGPLFPEVLQHICIRANTLLKPPSHDSHPIFCIMIMRNCKDPPWISESPNWALSGWFPVTTISQKWSNSTVAMAVSFSESDRDPQGVSPILWPLTSIDPVHQHMSASPPGSAAGKIRSFSRLFHQL